MKPVTLLCRWSADPPPPGPGLEALVATGLVEAVALATRGRIRTETDRSGT